MIAATGPNGSSFMMRAESGTFDMHRRLEEIALVADAVAAEHEISAPCCLGILHEALDGADAAVMRERPHPWCPASSPLADLDGFLAAAVKLAP